MEVSPSDQLLDEEARHDRLAGARVVREQEPERLAGQHGFVDGRDLVRERIQERGVDREDRVEEVRQADAVRFGDEPEELAVAVETPRPPGLDEIAAMLVVLVEKHIGDLSRRILVR